MEGTLYCNLVLARTYQNCFCLSNLRTWVLLVAWKMHEFPGLVAGQSARFWKRHEFWCGCRSISLVLGRRWKTEDTGSFTLRCSGVLRSTRDLVLRKVLGDQFAVSIPLIFGISSCPGARADSFRKLHFGLRA